MASTYTHIWELLVNVSENKDPQTRDYFLMQSPYVILAILGAYLHFVLKSGPKFMSNRQPFQLDTILLIYNASQIIFNTYIFTQIALILPRVDLVCGPNSDISQADASQIIYLVHKYIMLKLYDFLDTIFFVFRKKYKQITFLHVYHHTITFGWCWLTLRYLTWTKLSPSLPLFYELCNTMVHSVMYIYYLLSSYTRNIWWKKYVTLLQLVQHCTMLGLTVVDFLQPECNYEPSVLVFVGANFALMIYLFGEFYVKVYWSNKNVQKFE